MHQAQGPRAGHDQVCHDHGQGRGVHGGARRIRAHGRNARVRFNAFKPTRAHTCHAHAELVDGAGAVRWLPPALPVDEEADLLTKLGAVVIKSPASEEDNVTAMLQSMDQIFEAILDKECKITALERLLKVPTTRAGRRGVHTRAGRTQWAGRTQRARRNGRGAMGGAQVFLTRMGPRRTAPLACTYPAPSACVFVCVLQYFMPYIRDPDGVKRRRAVTVMDNLLERYVDMEAQKEEKLREVRRRTPFPSQRPASPSLANALVPFPSFPRQRPTSQSAR